MYRLDVQLPLVNFLWPPVGIGMTEIHSHLRNQGYLIEKFRG